MQFNDSFLLLSAIANFSIFLTGEDFCGEREGYALHCDETAHWPMDGEVPSA
jgi:hypothetical protein